AARVRTCHQNALLQPWRASSVPSARARQASKLTRTLRRDRGESVHPRTIVPGGRSILRTGALAARAAPAASPARVVTRHARRYNGKHMESLDSIALANKDYVAEQYRRFRSDPASVDEQWRLFFAGFELGGDGNGANGAAAHAAPRPEAAGGVFDLV